jgi:transcription antitermination factor NusG
MVRITAGPLAGITGELVSVSGRHKVLIKIDHLEQVLTISISPLLVEPYHPSVT